MVGRSLGTIMVGVAVLLAGCLTQEVPPRADGEGESQTLLSELHPALPDDPLTTEVVRGAARVIVNDAPKEARLFGFELKLREDDWHRSDSGFRTTDLHVAPFGDLEGYAVLLFEGGTLTHELYGLPFERDARGPLLDAFWPRTGVEPARIWFNQFDDAAVHAVVMVQGDGGVVIAPHDEPAFNPVTWSAARMLTHPAIVPDFIGRGSGFTFDAYLQNEGYVWNERIVYGDVTIQDEVPADLDPLDVAWMLTTEIEGELTGWSKLRYVFTAMDGAGTWESTIQDIKQRDLGGPWAHGTGYVSIAAFLAVGSSQWLGVGNLDVAPSTQGSVVGIGSGVAELYEHRQTTLGAPLEQLTGFTAPYDFWWLAPLVPAPAPAQLSSTDGNLVIDDGATVTMLVGAGAL